MFNIEFSKIVVEIKSDQITTFFTFPTRGFVIATFKVAKKASVLRRRKSRSKMEVSGNNISASQTIDPTQTDNEEFVFYVEDNKFGKSCFSSYLHCDLNSKFLMSSVN